MNSTRDAADLLTALATAADRFRKTGYAIFLRHQEESRWRPFSNYGGPSGKRSTGLGFVIILQDGRELCVSATVTATSDGLVISGDTTIDDDKPELAAGNQKYLLELPDAVTTTVPDCISTLENYVQQLTNAAPGLVAWALEQPHP
ncbi:hypothetical protein GCM10023205_85010 [Yinghuangia aomiensis]|uniref:Uncharacterized protein n=1 Tax=Yinghuangia aomiensis TaxID=676205 RepID=A0ABP9IK39_9ACTN